MARLRVLLTGLVALALLAAGCGNDDDAAGIPEGTVPADAPEPVADIDRDIPAIVSAANAFLARLDDDELATITLPLDSPLRPDWSNLPPTEIDFVRTGIRIGDLDDAQRSAMFEFFATSLSEFGYQFLLDVLEAESILEERPLAAQFEWSPDNYWVAFYGEPSEAEPWGWQFDGHHLAYNIGVVDGVVSMSPTFLGIEPAVFEARGETVTPMSTHVDDATDLYDSLPDDQRAEAELPNRPPFPITGPHQDGVIPPLEGSPVAGWDTEHREGLVQVVTQWVDAIPEPDSAERLAEVEADLDETYFAWFGSIDGPEGLYYRIQGPRLIIEFTTDEDLGGESGHYHTMYRNPSNEYGLGGLD